MARYSTAGLLFKRSTDGTSYTTIPNVASYDISGAQKEQIEATALNDTAKQFVDALPDFGSVTLTVFWDPADAVLQALYADYTAANTSRYWKIEFPTSGTVGDKTFQGPVTGWSESAAANGALQCTFVIKVSGAITLATS